MAFKKITAHNYVNSIAKEEITVSEISLNDISYDCDNEESIDMLDFIRCQVCEMDDRESVLSIFDSCGDSCHHIAKTMGKLQMTRL